MNKRIAIPVITVLAVGVSAAGYFVVQQTNKLGESESEIVALEENVSALEENVSTLEENGSILEVELSDLEAKVSTLEAALEEANDDVELQQKLVGCGAYCSFPLEVNGAHDFISSSFVITNPDGVSEITIDCISVFDTWGELIYEGDLLPLSDGTPQSGLMKPHEARSIQLEEYIPDEYTTESEAELLFTVEIFWTTKGGLPLTGWASNNIVRRDASTGELIELKFGGAIQMVNMEQELEPEDED